LLFACYNEVGKDRDHRAVHRHGDGDFLKRDAVEQDFHILNGVYRHACFADIAFNARMIAIIAAMGGKIEGH